MNDQNLLGDITLAPDSFAFLNLQGRDSWDTFAPNFTLTVVGTPSYSGRLKRIGTICFFQVQFSASTTIASTAGTSLLTLPITAAAGGLAGMATMTNTTTNIAVGIGHIDVAANACYLPAQVASGNTFTLAGWYEA